MSEELKVIKGFIPLDQGESKEQEELFRLLERLQSLRSEIKDHDTNVSGAEKFYQENILPLHLQLFDQKFTHLKLLDQLYESVDFTIFDQSRMRKYIRSKASDLIFQFGVREDVAEFISKYKEEEPEFHTPFETFFENLKNVVDESIKQYQLGFEEPVKEEPKKTKNAKIKEEVEDVELPEDLSSKNILRSLYTRIAKKLHPDLETDTELHEQRNEWMKKATEAYKTEDLFTLLIMYGTHIGKTEEWFSESTYVKQIVAKIRLQLEDNMQQMKERRKDKRQAELLARFGSSLQRREHETQVEKERIMKEAESLHKELSLLEDLSKLKTHIRKYYSDTGLF